MTRFSRRNEGRTTASAFGVSSLRVRAQRETAPDS